MSKNFQAVSPLIMYTHAVAVDLTSRGQLHGASVPMSDGNGGGRGLRRALDKLKRSESTTIYCTIILGMRLVGLRVAPYAKKPRV